MIKYGILENGPGYKPSVKYWCGGSYLPSKERQYWDSIRGSAISHDINAAYRYRSIMTAVWPAATYIVEEFND